MRKNVQVKFYMEGLVIWIVTQRSMNMLKKRGLFVFQATGNSAVLNNKPNFKPKAM